MNFDEPLDQGGDRNLGDGDGDVGDGDGDGYVSLDLFDDEMAVSSAPTLTRPDGTVVQPINNRPFELGVSSDGRFHLTFVIDTASFDGEELNYGVDVALQLQDAPASYTATWGEVSSGTAPSAGTAVMNFDEYPTVTSTSASGTVTLDSYIVESASGYGYDASVSLALSFYNVAFTTQTGPWMVNGTLQLVGKEGGVDPGVPPGDGDSDCLSGTWQTPTCGGVKYQQLTFDGESGQYTNPDCNDICTDLIFPFNYTVSGDSVTLSYLDPPQPSCNIENPPVLMKPENDDVFTFTCDEYSLVTTTSLGTTTYTRVY